MIIEIEKEGGVISSVQDASTIGHERAIHHSKRGSKRLNGGEKNLHDLLAGGWGDSWCPPGKGQYKTAGKERTCKKCREKNMRTVN